jgi:DNA replication and repair protein RecF
VKAEGVFLEQLSLYNFRNYGAETIPLGPGIYLIEGVNGTGKTNLVEAIYVLGNGRSWRPGTPAALLKAGETKGVIRGKICRQKGEGGGTTREIAVYLDGHTTGIVIDGSRQRSADAAREFPVIAFAPTDLELVVGGGEARREFLDRLGTRVIPGYASAKKRHDRALRQRTAVIKEYGLGRSSRSSSKSVEDESLQAWNEEFALRAAELLDKRLSIYSKVEPYLLTALESLDLGGEVAIRYMARLKEPISAGDLQEALGTGAGAIAEEYRRAISLRIGEELRRGQVLVGPQRDDLEVRIGGLSSRDGVSRGQQRLVAIGLRLAEAAVIQDAIGRRPVLVMDDVFSELDKGRRQKVWRYMRPLQGFITAASAESKETIDSEQPVYSITVEGGRVSHISGLAGLRHPPGLLG